MSNARDQTRLPDLPFEGYIQAPGQVDRKNPMSWFHATWDRVNGKLNAHEPYRTGFLVPNEVTSAAFVYFQIHGNPALSKGGGQRRPPEVNYSSACLDNSHAAYARDMHATCLIVLRPNLSIAMILSSHG